MSALLALVPTELLQWFDDAPIRYWSIAWIAGTFLVVTVALKLVEESTATPANSRRWPRWLLHPATFGLVTVAAICAFRWPMVFAGPLLNPDETQHGAAALTYWRDPVPWRSVDLHTSGPLNAYFLWPALLINGRVDYAGLRVAALFTHLVAALATYGVFRRFASDGTARLAALPFIAFVALTANWEFVQYSSEQLSIGLLGVAAWLLAVACTPGNTPEKSRRWRLIAAGACLGCLPFAKMQGILPGVAVGCIGLAGAGWIPAASRRMRAARVLSLMGGAAAPAALMAATLTVYGLWAQFHAAYIESNASYLSGYEAARMALLGNFIESFVTYSDGFAPFFWGMVIVALAAAFSSGIARLQPRALLAAAWVLLAVGVWTVIYPGRPFGHYLHFLFLPLAWLGGFSLIAIFRGNPPAGATPWAGCRQAGVALAFFAVTIVPQIVTRAGEAHPAIGSLVAARRNSLHPVSARLRELARPGDTLMVWGWFPRLHTESGLPQGTRESNNYREIEAIPMRTFFRERTLRDLRKNQPAFLVDAVCEGSFNYTDRRVAGLQVFPELQDYVAAHYRLEEELGGYRIYLRNDRASAAR
ncbi:MAG: hypothetical protein JWM88_2749 [Verrucomicrobia bacterium]|nr:hypothetical protein [Verrucomicrobiota bacterium]